MMAALHTTTSTMPGLKTGTSIGHSRAERCLHRPGEPRDARARGRPRVATSLARHRRMRWLAVAVLVAVSALLIVRAADGSLLRAGLADIVRSPRLLAVLLGAYAAA